MIRSMRRAVAAALVIVLCLGLCPSASAAAFPDVEGHWARAELLEAVDKGWLTGFEDGTLRPNEPATGAQVVTILCRILDAQSGSDSGVWYADAAAKAAALGLVGDGEPLTEPITRRRALCMMAEAFQIYDAGEDTSALGNFRDAVLLSGTDRAAIAAMVNKGYVSGDLGLLKLSDNLTRAQLCAVLSRILSDGEVRLNGSVSNWRGGTLWIGCGSGDVRLKNVKADTVVVRTQGLENLTVESCEIGTLVLAHDGDFSLEWPEGTALRIGSGIGSVQVSGGAGRLDVTGDGRVVELSAAPGGESEAGPAAVPDAVYISGEKAHVILPAGAQRAVISGAGATLAAGGTVKELEINAQDVTVDGAGSVGAATVRAPGASLPKGTNTTEDIDPGLDNASVSLSHPETLPVGEMLRVSAEVQNAAAGLSGWVTWTFDGQTALSEPATLSGQALACNHWYTYTRNLAATSHITFRFDYVTRYGKAQSLSAEIDQQVENYDKNHYDEIDSARVLELVTSGYQGDYTLEWAQNHDYTDEDKVTFVNAKGYVSSSQYLIWINKTYQRVNIFEGYKWNWKLIRSGIVATGAAGGPPPGIHKVTYKEKGWFTSHYIVRPVVRFYGGGYAMHSRLYQPYDENVLSDPAIGFPRSAGCVRMMDEDIYWIYDNVPEGTTVVVY